MPLIITNAQWINKYELPKMAWAFVNLRDVNSLLIYKGRYFVDISLTYTKQNYYLVKRNLCDEKLSSPEGRGWVGLMAILCHAASTASSVTNIRKKKSRKLKIKKYICQINRNKSKNLQINKQLILGTDETVMSVQLFVHNFNLHFTYYV